MQNKQVHFITKLGGCAITDKTCFETLNVQQINAAAETLAKCHKAGLIFVVIHGAGSFGHHHAREYGVNKGHLASGVSKQRVIEGFCKTRLSVSKLNHHVVQALVDHGIPAVGVSPCGTWSTDRGFLTEDGTASVSRLLDSGFIPCLHGDCVLDQSLGCTILSGDVIIQRLCGVLSPDRVVFLTDVPGIYTHPPTQSDAELIPRIRVRHDGKMDKEPHTSTSHEHDVTGGIRLKLNCAVEIVLRHKKKITVIVCGSENSAFENICLSGTLNGKRGTVVECENDMEA